MVSFSDRVLLVLSHVVLTLVLFLFCFVLILFCSYFLGFLFCSFFVFVVRAVVVTLFVFVVVVVVTPPTACLKLLRLAACVYAYVRACVVLYNTFVGHFE